MSLSADGLLGLTLSSCSAGHLHDSLFMPLQLVILRNWMLLLVSCAHLSPSQLFNVSILRFVNICISSNN